MAAFKDSGMSSVREREVKGLKKGGDLLGGGRGRGNVFIHVRMAWHLWMPSQHVYAYYEIHVTLLGT